MKEFPTQNFMFLALFQLLLGRKSGIVAGSFVFSPAVLLETTCAFLTQVVSYHGSDERTLLSAVFIEPSPAQLNEPQRQFDIFRAHMLRLEVNDCFGLRH